MHFIKPMGLTDKSLILDVRTAEEHACAKLELPHINKNLAELDPLDFIRENNISDDETINILCSSGARASQAAEMFEEAGFSNVAVIIGGIVEAEYEGMHIVRRSN